MPINIDVNDYKINMSELSPVTGSGNIISMVHGGESGRAMVKEGMKAMQSAQIAKAVEKAQEAYLGSLKTAV